MPDPVVLKTIAYSVERDGVTFMIRDKDGEEAAFKVSPQHLQSLMARIASAAADTMQFVNDEEANQIARVMVADRIGAFQAQGVPGVLLRLENGSKLPIALGGNTLEVLHAATADLLQRRKPG